MKKLLIAVVSIGLFSILGITASTVNGVGVLTEEEKGKTIGGCHTCRYCNELRDCDYGQCTEEQEGEECGLFRNDPFPTLKCAAGSIPGACGEGEWQYCSTDTKCECQKIGEGDYWCTTLSDPNYSVDVDMWFDTTHCD
jgi:hypothetical protein